jgi:hypothetical protein
MTNPLDEALSGSGAKSAFGKHSQVGDRVTGKVIDATIRQRTDYHTGALKTWDDGKPQNQVAVRIQTGQRADADDDGIRGVYIKTWGADKDALMNAIKDAGGTKASDVLKPGAVFTATFIRKDGNEDTSPKFYAYEINPNGAVDDALTPAQPTPGAATQAAAQHVATAEDDQAKKVEAAKQLITLGQADAAIAAVTGLDLAVIAAIRNTL